MELDGTTIELQVMVGERKASSLSAAAQKLCTRKGARKCIIVIVNSRFLERPHKRSRRNQLIHRRLKQNKIDRQRSRSRESGRQTVRRLWWMVFGVETGREVRGRR